MIRAARRRHFVMQVVLMLAVAMGAGAALGARPWTSQARGWSPAEPLPVSAGEPLPVRASEGAEALVASWSGAARVLPGEELWVTLAAPDPLRLPDPLVYWVEADTLDHVGGPLPERAILLGQLRGIGPQDFEMPWVVAGQLAIYSLSRQQVVAVVDVPANLPATEGR